MKFPILTIFKCILIVVGLSGQDCLKISARLNILEVCNREQPIFHVCSPRLGCDLLHA